MPDTDERYQMLRAVEQDLAVIQNQLSDVRQQALLAGIDLTNDVYLATAGRMVSSVRCAVMETRRRLENEGARSG